MHAQSKLHHSDCDRSHLHYRDLMVGKRPAALITTFLIYKAWNLYFVDILYVYILTK